MNRIELKQRATKLRKKGRTYSEINQLLSANIPKSTFSYWFKDVLLPESYYTKIGLLNFRNLQKARISAVLANKKKQEQIIKGLREGNESLFQCLNKDVCKLILSVMYYSEGSKHRSTRSLRLSNSDPMFIKLYLKLLNKCYLISQPKLRVSIGCRADQSKKELVRYWYGVTRIPLTQFYKPRIDKRTIGKKTRKKEYKGVCIIDYFDTRIQLELENLAQQIEGWL